ncbi:MAG: type II toxin-antitoxin system HipA family toxin, partial [Polyangiaceae bacterium]
RGQRVNEKSLGITLSSIPVGDLTQDPRGRTTWTPDAHWESGGQHPRLGAAFLREPGRRRVAVGLPAWFENLLPEDGSPLRRRLCALHGLRSGQSFALLSAVGRDLSGAVEAGYASARVPKRAGVRVGGDEGDAGLSVGATGRLSPLAGMQLKFSMSMSDDRLSLPAQGSGGQWIVKIPGKDYEDLPAVEAATMSWAEHAGFDVPPHRVLSSDSLAGLPPSWHQGVLAAFATARFDRRPDGSKVHQEDLCQALDVFPKDKYGDASPVIAFDGALRFVTDMCGEAVGREMARRMGFVIASGNGDAHLKNWSLLWGETTRPGLTPCYDFVATISLDALGWAVSGGPQMALRLGGERRFARVDRKALAAHTKNAGQAWAEEEIMAGIEGARRAWPQARESAPLRMREAIAKHWASVPLSRTIGLAG